MSLSNAEVAYEMAHKHQDLRPTIIAVIGVFAGIAVVTTFARLVSRWFQGKAYALDDWLMIPGTILMGANSIAGSFEAHFGYGVHILYFDPANSVPLGKWEVVNLWTYIYGVALVKLSILMLIWRIFNGHGQQGRAFTWTVYFLIGYLVCWVIALSFAFGFQCRPFSSQWSVTDRCIPPNSLSYSATSLNAAHDVAVFLLPQPIVWKLQMPVRKKITISIIFTIGIIATIAGILKIVFLLGVPGSSHPEDATYNIATADIMTSLEVQLAVICGNLPAIPTLFQKLQLTELASSIRSSLSRLIPSRTSSKTDSSSPNYTKEENGTAVDSDVVITSGWEVSKEQATSLSTESSLRKDAVPFE